MLAMFPPFVAVLIGIGVPPLLAVYSLLCLANLTAGPHPLRHDDRRRSCSGPAT